MERGITYQRAIIEITRAPHAKLHTYLAPSQGDIVIASPSMEMAARDPEFFAHLIAWNAKNGQVRDAKVALPLVALKCYVDDTADPAFLENALALLAELDPKEFLRAVEFSKDTKTRTRMMARLAKRYLAEHAQRKDWERSAIAHRRFLKRLYAWPYPTGQINPPDHVNALLFGPSKKRPQKAIPHGYGKLFAALHAIACSTAEIAAGILEKFPNLPFLAARGAVGDKAKDPNVLRTLISRMSSTELVTNAKWLQRLGVSRSSATRGEMERALDRSSAPSRRGGQLKANRAAETLAAAGDATMAEKMHGLQERQIDAGRRIKGDWLILADRSPSMKIAIDAARQVAAALTRFCDGNVSLLFFADTPRYFEISGKTYAEILALTRTVTDGGNGTSIGCGLQYALEHELPFSGIVIVSDMQENTAPKFADQYKRLDSTPPVYLYRLAPGSHGLYDVDLATSCRVAGIDVTEFDIRGGFDYTSLPNLVLTMRAGRFALVDEVFDTPLKTLDAVLPRTTDMRVLPELVKARA